MSGPESGASWADPPPRSLADVLRRRARETPDKVATVCEGRVLSFRDLDDRANRVAHALMAATAVGDRVALLDSNSDAFYELLFGVARCSRVLVPLGFRLAEPEIVDILNASGTVLLVLGAAFADRRDHLRAACPALTRIVVIGAPEGSGTYDDWLDGPPPPDPHEDGPASTPVMLVYSSGTTGQPKGATLTQANLLVAPAILLREYGCRADDVALVCLPVSHVSGGLWGVSSLYAGMPTVILRPTGVVDILAAIQAHRVTKVFLVPALLQRLVEQKAGHDCSTLDLIVYGGSPIAPALLREAVRAFGCQFAQLYGLTETAGAVCYLTPADHLRDDDALLDSCGRPLPGVELRVVDEAGNDVPVGTPGEIVVRGRQIMRGYWPATDDRTSIFHGDWLRTGDVGVVDAAGYVYVRDRLKDMIITGGEKVYPAEVEQVLARHAAVADVAVFGLPDPQWGEAVACAVVPAPGASPDAEELRAFARQYLARYKVPSRVSVVPSLPRNAAGKVLKRELRERGASLP
ncbi:MAG: long-chain-fatty-acid--CoA ligase [Vicinamibacterales bacterium]